MATVYQVHSKPTDHYSPVRVEFPPIDAGLPMAEKLFRSVTMFIEAGSAISPELGWWTHRPDGSMVSGTQSGVDEGGGRWRFRLPRTCWGRYLSVVLEVGGEVPLDMLIRPYIELDLEVLRDL